MRRPPIPVRDSRRLFPKSLPALAWILRDRRVFIWLGTASGTLLAVFGQVLAIRRVEGAVPALYAGFMITAVGGALHSIAFWFAPGKDGVRSRFDKLAWFLRPYPFLEIFLALMWLLALVISAVVGYGFGHSALPSPTSP